MSYAIDEKNAERQDLLAHMLKPLTSPVLDRIPRDSINKILDLGCGHGHTTRVLAERFPEASAIGFEYDEALVDRARADPNNPPGISFQQGDASTLPFPDTSFRSCIHPLHVDPCPGPCVCPPRDVSGIPAWRLCCRLRARRLHRVLLSSECGDGTNVLSLATSVPASFDWSPTGPLFSRCWRDELLRRSRVGNGPRAGFI